MNRLAIDKFVQYLEQHKIDYELREFENAVNVKILGTAFAVELRAEKVIRTSGLVVTNPEYIMTWGVDDDDSYGSVENKFESILAAYKTFSSRVAK